MFRSLYTAASGMIAQQLNLDNVAHNLANASTAGFRRRRLQFQDTLYQNMVMPGSAATQQTTVAAGLQIGLGSRTAASEMIQTQGDFTQTGNPLDLMINGQGFFQVRLPSGETAFTRSGAFHLDSQGNVVTADGDPLDPAITVPAGATSVSIGADGTVTVSMPGQDQAQQVGNIQLAFFPNPGGLNSVGKNMFLQTSSSGDPIVGTPGGSEGLGSLQQGMLEQSNVNVVDEFIQMILAQRSYEANSKVVRASDEMYEQLNNIPR
jgi:flagellar basal-body rod protein FlgG